MGNEKSEGAADAGVEGVGVEAADERAGRAPVAWPFEPLAPGSFEIVLADPPWKFKGYRPDVPGSRDIERHYPTMNLAAIKALPVGDLAARDAHLWIWTTGPYLEKTFEVIRAWGFRYSGMGFTWIKLRRALDPLQFRFTATADTDLHVGMGYTTRKNAEFCLLARRGNARRVDKAVREVILAPVREHSRKPEEARLRIERYAGDVRRADLFSREPRPGWESWGNEIHKFAR